MHDIDEEAIAGGWRALCIGVLVQGVQRVEAASKLQKPGSKSKLNGNGGLDKEILKQRAIAKEWIKGGVGLVTFEDCCEAMEVDPDNARQKIEGWCYERRRRPNADVWGRDVRSSLTEQPSAG